MITRIHAQNFKSWKDTGDIRLAPLTGLFGTNSSGKTSILQMLLLMKQTVESTDRRQVLRLGDDRSLVNLGTFSDLIHNHQLGEGLNLSLSWKLPKPLIINDPVKQEKERFNIRELTFETLIDEDSGHVDVGIFSYKFDHYTFGMFSLASDGHGTRYGLQLPGVYRVKLNKIRLLPPPVKCYGFPEQAIGYYPNTEFLPDFPLEFENLFDRMAYLGPLREYPKRTYLWTGERPSDVGIRGEGTIAALLAARPEKSKDRETAVKGSPYRSIEERILEWLKKMHLIHSFSLQTIAPDRKEYEFRFKRNEKSSEVLITDVGFGVSQLLPVLVLCYYVPENSIIILEQPEIHLHPSVQADLADVLIEVAKERNIQIIVESHSEHLLRRIQRRIAEEEIQQDDVALYFCRMEDGESKIEELEVDEFGNISNWPQNFFGDEMGDLVAMTEAAMKREIKNNS